MKTKTTQINREAWLTAAVAPLSDLLSVPVPPCRVSVGWPSRKATALHQRRIGECWAKTLAADGLAQVFISPVLSKADEVLATLLHELIHVALPDAGHRGPFVRVARAAGLEGKPTATVAGVKLTERLNALAESIGPYPHAALSVTATGRKPGSRLRLWECSCGVKVRVAKDDFSATCSLCDSPFERGGAA